MFYDNLKSVCDSKGIKITPLVAECGGAKGSISNWKKGASPNSDIVVNLAVRLNVPTDLLLLGNIKHETKNSDADELISIYDKLSSKSKNFVLERARTLYDIEANTSISELSKVPTIKCKHSYYKVSAGKGFSLGDGDDWQDEIEIPDTPLNRKADFCVTIKGDSMEPLFKDDDTVLVKSQDSVEPGQIGIFNVGGEGFIKKFGGDRLISLNEEYDDILFSEHQYENIKCVGIVLGRI